MTSWRKTRQIAQQQIAQEKDIHKTKEIEWGRERGADEGKGNVRKQ